MAVRFKVRRGSTAPIVANLEAYEMGFNSVDGTLYINNNGTVNKMNCGDADTLDTLDSTQFLRSDQSDTLNGDLTVTGTVFSTAQTALYADIAENYETDKTYEPGDVLMFGIETEATLADGTRPIMGVCSTNPAYLMNRDIDAVHYAPVALKGRIPVKVSGEVRRGDHLMLVDGEVVAGFSSNKDENTYIGIALSANIDGFAEVKV